MELTKKISDAYIKHILENGSMPNSVYSFCKGLKITEEKFYEHFSALEDIETSIWKSYITDTITDIMADDNYTTYSVREKLLAFYFTLVEKFKANRSFLLKAAEKFEKPVVLKSQRALMDAEASFMAYAKNLLMEARETQEVEQRPVPQIMNQYPKIWWKETVFILDFWLKDRSKLFEKTDSLIEKTVNTTMDLMARSPLDSLFDLGKFVLQNQKMATAK